MNKKIYREVFFLPSVVLFLIILAVLADEILRLSLPVPAAILPLAVGGGCVCYDTVTTVWHSRKVTSGILVVLALIGSVWTGEFMEGAEVSFMMLLGEALEEFAMEKTRDTVEKLVEHNASGYTAHVAHTGVKGSAGRLADRFSEYFFPIILAFGILVWFLTRDIQRVMTIFVIACPCSLVLSSPIAVLACTGKAAESGILLPDGETVEKCGAVRRVSFDKGKDLYVADNGLTLGCSKGADVLLLKKDDAVLSCALALTRKTCRIIRQNIFLFACLLNLTGILLSGLGLLNPVLGAVLHNASTICVVLNSLRIFRWKQK